MVPLWADSDFPLYSDTPPQSQYFSLPYNFIKYITENPSTFKGFQKLQQTCKYFYFKKNVIAFQYFCCSDYKPFSYYNPKCKSAKRRNLYGKFQFWFTNLSIRDQTFPSFSKYIYRCNLFTLQLCYENLTFKEICFLLNGGNIEKLLLEYVNIRHEDGINSVTMDQILAQCPKISHLRYSNICEIYSTQTFENLHQIHLPSKIKSFGLTMCQINGKIDPQTLCHFLKNNVAEATNPWIIFQCKISGDDYDNFKTSVLTTLGDYFGPGFSVFYKTPL